MKNIILILISILVIVSCRKDVIIKDVPSSMDTVKVVSDETTNKTIKDTTTDETIQKPVIDTVAVTPPIVVLTTDEIPIDEFGNFEFDKCSTTNTNILDAKNIYKYLNYNLERGTEMISKVFRCNYLIVKDNDTILNTCILSFLSNAKSTEVRMFDGQYKIADFRNYDKIMKRPTFIGYVTKIEEDRIFSIQNNMLKISQIPVENSTVTYKLLCIQKDEDYMRVLVDGKYNVKFILKRSVYTGYNDFLDIIKNVISDKYFYTENFTTLNTTNFISYKTSF